MNITDNLTEKVKFETVHCGDIFSIDGTPYVKIRETTVEGAEKNAVSLEFGYLTWIDNNIKVISAKEIYIEY